MDKGPLPITNGNQKIVRNHFSPKKYFCPIFFLMEKGSFLLPSLNGWFVAEHFTGKS